VPCILLLILGEYSFFDANELSDETGRCPDLRLSNRHAYADDITVRLEQETIQSLSLVAAPNKPSTMSKRKPLIKQIRSLVDGVLN
ncbi:MAG: hypothetical protein QF609_10835, partial [Gammaproteobacteria bacterium]|nr:hypothetical protein [Gammaproteobacteria bacterium]